MTMEEIETERRSGLSPVYTAIDSATKNTETNTNSCELKRQFRPLTMNEKFLNPKNSTEDYKRSLKDEEVQYMNFNDGMAANVLKTLVRTEQRQKARKDVINDKEKGLTEAERLKN